MSNSRLRMITLCEKLTLLNEQTCDRHKLMMTKK